MKLKLRVRAAAALLALAVQRSRKWRRQLLPVAGETIDRSILLACSFWQTRVRSAARFERFTMFAAAADDSLAAAAVDDGYSVASLAPRQMARSSRH